MVSFSIKLGALILLPFILARSIQDEEEERRLIQVGELGLPVWLSEDEIWSLIQNHTHFIDVTDYETGYAHRNISDSSGIPTKLRFQSEIRPLLGEIDIKQMEDFIGNFSSFRTRYFKSSSGVRSEKWLFERVQEISSSGNSSKVNITVNEFKHSWPQPSIVARMEGTDKDLKDTVVILGAHQDSINKWGGIFTAPGADDNASGSAVLLEVFRVLAKSQIAPKRSIEFHWYAAEEVGLRGSGDIARKYRTSGIEVISMMNYDVPGYYGPKSKNYIGIYTDHTDPQLNTFLRQVVDEYCVWGWKDRECGYGCSDHASWTKNGYSAAMPGVMVWNPKMHTGSDTVEIIGFEQLREFTKLAVAATVEIAEV